MAYRNTRTQVTFKQPFMLPEFEHALPAGTYDVDTEEEGVEGNERTVYIRTATLIHVRGPGTTSTVTIDPVGLANALQADR